MRKKNVVPSFPAIWRFIGNCLAVILDSKGKPCRFLGPRGPLIEPSIPVRPSFHLYAPIFPEFIDELKHCRQASGTPQIAYFMKADDVSYPNSNTETSTKTNTETNTKTETNKGRS